MQDLTHCMEGRIIIDLAKILQITNSASKPSLMAVTIFKLGNKQWVIAAEIMKRIDCDWVSLKFILCEVLKVQPF